MSRHMVGAVSVSRLWRIYAQHSAPWLLISVTSRFTGTNRVWPTVLVHRRPSADR